MILTASRLHQLATQYPLLKDNWHYLTAATLTACNQPDELPVLYHFALKREQFIKSNRSFNDDELFKEAVDITNKFINLNHRGDFKNKIFTEVSNAAGLSKENNFKLQLQLTECFREGLLKSIALVGLPKVINSMILLKSVTPEPLRLTTPNRDFAIESDLDIRKRGEDYWNKIYKGKLASRISNQLNQAHPDLWGYTLNHVYAPLLSFSKILSPKNSSLLIISCLIPQDVNPQLKGHYKGALNNGCTPEEINQARDLAISVSKWSGITWKNEVALLKTKL
ncbi:hypothetical protein WICMUC_005334 [Wickerhamomyces mucosus]|uniref:Carboxymuconolactone decarboxylase-like domain-containing protein n=1 Tax=Wickerhamomyces mucosus TaxID=1378264 RepID=A0A9P8P8Y7_9ASCO|nr:hypothetical protein WICMUC_005334 [Wickerhamomyces mucosus]